MRHDHMEKAEDEIKDILLELSFKEATTVLAILLAFFVTIRPTTRDSVMALYTNLANAACDLVEGQLLH